MDEHEKVAPAAPTGIKVKGSLKPQKNPVWHVQSRAFPWYAFVDVDGDEYETNNWDKGIIVLMVGLIVITLWYMAVNLLIASSAGSYEEAKPSLGNALNNLIVAGLYWMVYCAYQDRRINTMYKTQ